MLWICDVDKDVIMDDHSYKRLAEHLDALPNGFPPAEDGAELCLLAKLFTPEEAALAAQLRLTLETVSCTKTMHRWYGCPEPSSIAGTGRAEC